MSTVLIVDDELPIRDILVTLFDAAGYQVIEAIHGGQALDLIEQARPDLIVSDVMMPVLNGAELCRRLKRQAATKKIPVILMSSAGSHVAREAGADAFIEKPFNIDEMEALVRRWLGGKVPG